MSEPRTLFAALLALGLVVTALAGVVPATLEVPWGWAVLLFVPLTAGALGSLLVHPRRRRLRFPAEVRVPSLHHLPLVAVLVLLDLGAIALGERLGWCELVVPASSRDALRAAAIFLGLPIAFFVAVHGWEWGLRARLYGPWSRRGSRGGAALATVLAGVVLALPTLLPGFRSVPRVYLVAALVTALAREATALRLFRRSGVLLSGAYRGFLLGFEALVLADLVAAGSAAAFYRADDPRFYPLRAALPLVAWLVATLWCGRLDRLDAERRRRP